ncbi:hypothetical protein ACFYYR_09260 [Streptomyces sp. NPDC001922]|uniref:hypothetical protein n=1 Tax=Streptomyces sp. NPDC001922 TaxID=3364624 RepID=UPI0036777AC1
MTSADQGPRLRAVTDLAPARWIESRTGDFHTGVHALLPSGFAAYARVLHPVEASGGTFLRWAEVAERAGRPLHSRVRFTDIAPGAGDAEPWQGSFEAELLPDLCEVLAAHTTTPESCYLGLWDGWGWLTADGPRVHLSGRAYLLYEGPVEAATDLGDRGAGCFLPQSPNLWWPRDRAWCVATDVDLDSTYIGGPAPLIEELTGSSRLEAVRAELSDPLS